jgi:type VI secretion system secreted protein VgrG
VRISAKKEIVLECGGAFVQLKDGNVTLGGPADLFFKVITIQKKGAVSMQPVFPVLPQSELSGKFSLRFATFGSDLLMLDRGWVGKSFRILDSNGATLQAGRIAKNGRLPRIILDAPDTLKLNVGEDDWTTHQLQLTDDVSETDSGNIHENENPFPIDLTSSSFLTDENVEDLIPASDFARVIQGEG